MFTDGLNNNNALRWVREKQAPNLRNGRGFDLPPPSKFRSGHLPTTAIPVSRTLARDAEESAFASENDGTTESEDDVCGGRYSLDSSPQDPRIAHSKGNAVQQHPRYASDYGYSDVSSSRETIFGRGRIVWDRLVRGNGRTVYTEEDEEEESDSAASSEFSTTQVGSVSGVSGLRRRTYFSEGYAWSVTSHANVKDATRKDLRSRIVHNEKFSDDDDVDVPSAPPFSGTSPEIKQDAEQIPVPIVQNATVTANHGSTIRNDLTAFKSMSGVKPDDCIGKRNSDQFSRTAAGAFKFIPISSPNFSCKVSLTIK